MKVEMYEKIGEINIVTLRSAEENQQIARETNKRKDEEERMRKEKEEKENRLIANKVLLNLINAINTSAEEGKTFLEIVWNKDTNTTPHSITFEEYKRGEKYFKPVLESAGYKVNSMHVYSKNYTKQSGKQGYVFIFWS